MTRWISFIRSLARRSALGPTIQTTQLTSPYPSPILTLPTTTPTTSLRKGKVAELLDMVARARKKLGRPAEEPTLPNLPNPDPRPLSLGVDRALLPSTATTTATATAASALPGPKRAVSPKWKPRPPIEFFLSGHRQSTKAAGTAGASGKQGTGSSKAAAAAAAASGSASAIDYNYDIYELQRSLESSDPRGGGAAGQAGLDSELSEGEDEDETDAEADAEAEQRLNNECEVLRQKLEDKIGAAITAGHIKSPVKRAKEKDGVGALSTGGALTAAGALQHWSLAEGGADRFENSLAAALLQQWAEEDAADEQEGGGGGEDEARDS